MRLVGVSTRHVGLLIHSVGLLVCRTIGRWNIKMTPFEVYFRTSEFHQAGTKKQQQLYQEKLLVNYSC